LNHKASRFTKEDEPWLLAQDEAMLDKLMPSPDDTVEAAAAPVAPVTQSAPAVSALSAEDQAALAYGKRLLQERRAKMIQGIQANAAGIWPEATLTAMNEDTLEMLYKSVQKPAAVDYSPLGGGAPQTNSTVAPLLPAGTEAK
jgi:hypothetical protein